MSVTGYFPPPRVSSLVAGILNKLVDEVAVSPVDLDAVKSRTYGVLHCLGKIPNRLEDFGLMQWPGVMHVAAELTFHGDVARRDQIVSALFHELRVCRTSHGPDLHVDIRSLVVNGSGDFFPGFGLRFVPYPRDVGVAAMARADNSGFGDQKTTGNTGALFVEVLDKGERYVVIINSCAGHGSHRNAVAHVHPSDLERAEELRHRV